MCKNRSYNKKSQAYINNKNRFSNGFPDLFSKHAHMNEIPEKSNRFDSVSFSIWTIGEILCRTLDFSVTGRDDLDLFHDTGKGRIYCCWHSHLLPLAFFFRNTGKSAIISESSDGRRAAAVARKWGYSIIHGSSTRGGAAALRDSVRALQEGINVVVTPDGPRGPRETVKSGIAQIAIMANATIVPVAAFPSSAWKLNSWDRFVIPVPFAHIDVRLRDPIVPADFSREDDPESALVAAIQEGLGG